MLAWCANCEDRAGLAALLRQASGTLPARRAERLPRLDRADPASRIERAAAIWRGAERIEPGSPAHKYLERRRISHVATSPALRWRADCPHPGGGRHLALLAAVSAADGGFAGVQRIFLDRDGRKAAIEPVKASLGLIAGGAVRLQNTSAELVIGEGIESAAAAGALLNLPAWAAVSCGNLANSMILPAEIRRVIIAVDRDEAGERAAREAGARWKNEGKSVRFLKPSAPGADAADILAARGAA